MFDSPVNDQAVADKWAEIGPIIEHLQGNSDLLVPKVQPRSPLAGDDRVATPYQTSHAVSQSLIAAVDHLHAAKVLVHDANFLHLAAPASLARGVIENAAAAIWILRPNARNTRLERTLRWYATDAQDQERAFPGAGVPLKTTLGRIENIAATRNIAPKAAVRRYTSTGVVVEADKVVDMNLEAIWRICSGFAHGRRWPTIGLLNRQAVPSDDADAAAFSISNDGSLVLFYILCGTFTVQEALRLQQKRNMPFLG